MIDMRGKEIGLTQERVELQIEIFMEQVVGLDIVHINANYCVCVAF
jgi:hypothetical protein